MPINPELSPVIAKAIEQPKIPWDFGMTEPIHEENAPEVLLQPAKGQFASLEMELYGRYGLSIPESWQVQHMLALCAWGAAYAANKKLPASEHVDMDRPDLVPEITLIDNNCYHTDEFGDYPHAFSFTVVSGNKVFHGSVFSPFNTNNIQDKKLFGIPSYVCVDELLIDTNGKVVKPEKRSIPGVNPHEDFLGLGDFISEGSTKFPYMEAGENMLSFIALQIVFNSNGENSHTLQVTSPQQAELQAV